MAVDNVVYKAVVFDVDGVLLDSTKAHSDAFDRVFAMYGIKDFDYSAYAGMTTRAVVENVLRSREIKSTAEVVAALVTKKTQLAERGGAFIMKDGALDLIKALQQRQIPMAIASSGNMFRIKAFLHHYNISDCFRFISVVDEHNRPKPFPDLYLQACTKIGFESKECIAIEDSIAGVISARDARMRVYGLLGTCTERQLKDVGCHVLMSALSEFPR